MALDNNSARAVFEETLVTIPLELTSESTSTITTEREDGVAIVATGAAIGLAILLLRTMLSIMLIVGGVLNAAYNPHPSSPAITVCLLTLGGVVASSPCLACCFMSCFG